MRIIESVVKYGFIFFIGSVLTVGGRLWPYGYIRFNIRRALNSRHANQPR
jgi:hypothetical protein